MTSSESLPDRTGGGSRSLWAAALVLAFAFRLAFGLASNFWTEDERQIYLIGLKFFTTGQWPYFGPDVVWTRSQIPGALQGLLVGGPLFALPWPEAPFLLVNLLSFAALSLLAWYMRRRLPRLPAWFVWAWLLTAPWTLHFSTHVTNPSYVLPASILFFVGFFEATAWLSIAAVPRPLAWAMMGFAIVAILQLHMSWVLLPAYALVAFASWFGGASHGNRIVPVSVGRRVWGIPVMPPRDAAWWIASFAGGALVASATLVPTIAKYGFSAGGAAGNVRFNVLGAWDLLLTLGRILSFASFEVAQFVGLDTASRLVFLATHPFLAPLAVGLAIVGGLQVAALAVLWFRRATGDRGWRGAKFVLAGTIAWVFVSYFFSVRKPQPHAFYTILPVVMIYSLYCWNLLLTTRRRWMAAKIILVAGVVFHMGLAWVAAPVRSLYWNRRIPQTAIDARDYRMLGERRVPAFEERAAAARPPRPALPAGDPLRDVRLSAAWSRPVFGLASGWSFSVTNTSSAVAYGDISYRTDYFDASGTRLVSGLGILKYIVEPGETRRFDDVTDGLAWPGAVRATATVIGAETDAAAYRAGGAAGQR